MSPPNLSIVQNVAVDLGERGVPVGESAKQNDELQQVRVCLLPERFLRSSEQIVQQRGDGIRHGVRVEVVVERVVTDAGVESDLDVVFVSSSVPQDGQGRTCPLKSPFDLQHQTANLPLRPSTARQPQQSIESRIHAGGRLAGTHRAQNHDSCVQSSLRDRQP